MTNAGGDLGEHAWAHRGLVAALSRLSVHLATNQDPTIPLFECLQWVYALDQHEKALAGDAYFQRRAFTIDGRAVGALTWVRGISTHSLVAPARELELYPSADLFPSDDLFPGAMWRWRFLDELPTSTMTSRDRDVWYRQVVQQMPVDRSLEAARRFFS